MHTPHLGCLNLNPQQIFDAIPNPLLVLNEEDGVCFANTVAEDFFQTSASLLSRYSIKDLVPFASPVLSTLAQARAETGVMNAYSVGVGTPKYGGERIVDVQISPIPDNPRYVVICLLRRSMAHKFDSQLSHQGAARAVSGMAAMLAHEIKNPLSGIKGAAQLLEPNLDRNDRLLARLICEETDRIRDLVDQMEVFSDERPLAKTSINIHLVLDRVKQLIQSGAFGKITLIEEYDPSLPPILGHHDQLVQVFLNLAKNAAEALGTRDEPGEIIFSTAFRPGVKLAVPGSKERVTLPFEVCITDNGPGIAADILPHIFEAFVTSKPQGRGLGLALVAKIIRDHGGVVECVPREQGTCFRILLPLHKETSSKKSKA